MIKAAPCYTCKCEVWVPDALWEACMRKRARRDARVRRVHITRGERRLCNDKPWQDGDVRWTNNNLLGPTPNNTCKRCRLIYSR